MNYIEIIEKSLGFQLTTTDIDKANLDYLSLQKLYYVIKDFHRNSDFPQKKNNILRPFLSPSYTVGKKLYWYMNNHWTEPFKYGFKKPENYPLVDLCKKYLLYCNSICIEDPLIYLLDFFGERQETRYSKERTPTIIFILKEYALIRSLIIEETIVFVSEERIGFTKQNFYLSETDISELKKHTKLEEEDIRRTYPPILKDISIKNKLQNGIDLFFPHQDFVEVYYAFLKSTQEKFDSKYVTQPFYNGIVGSIDSINVEAVTISDIENLRKNEELFFLWRSFVNKILDELYNSKGHYSDLNQEFIAISKEKFKEVDIKLKKKLHNSGYLRNIISSSEQAVVGVITGALAGQALNMSAELPMLVGGVSPYIKLIFDSIRNVVPMKETIAINNHFLALQLK